MGKEKNLGDLKKEDGAWTRWEKGGAQFSREFEKLEELGLFIENRKNKKLG